MLKPNQIERSLMSKPDQIKSRIPIESSLDIEAGRGIGTAAVGPVVERAAAEGEDDDEERENGGIDDGDALPLALDFVEQTRFARIAVVAESVLIVRPLRAIAVGREVAGLGHIPLRPIHVRQIARHRRLAAARLQSINQSINPSIESN
jgi:hypothetical protein